MHIQVIGDELYADGMVVALFAQRGVPATTMSELVDGLENGTLFEAEKLKSLTQDELADMKSDQVLELLHTAFKRVERNGLLRWSDVKKVVAQFASGELQ